MASNEDQKLDKKDMENLQNHLREAVYDNGLREDSLKSIIDEDLREVSVKKNRCKPWGGSKKRIDEPWGGSKKKSSGR